MLGIEATTSTRSRNSEVSINQVVKLVSASRIAQLSQRQLGATK